MLFLDHTVRSVLTRLADSYDDVLHHAVAVGIPMRTRFRGTEFREALLLPTPEDVPGPGWVEFSPFAEYGPQESSRWLAAALEIGWAGYPLERLHRTRIPVNATVPSVPADTVPQVLAHYGDSAPLAVKVKIAEQPAPNTAPDPQIHGMDADIARVARVRELLPDAAIRVDANRGLSGTDALELLRELEQFGLEYAEQPVETTTQLAQLRQDLAAADIQVPLAADESIRKITGGLDKLAQVTDAADVGILKVQPLGGIRNALAIGEFLGLDMVVSSALDTSLGIHAGMVLAGCLPELNHGCGLGTISLFTDDVVDEPLTMTAGHLTLSEDHPTGPHVNPEALERLRLPTEREAWWRDRARQAYSVLAGGDA